MERGRLTDVCAWAKKKRLHLLVDEIYQGLNYVDDMPSVLELDQSAFVVNSFSKYFGMTGWRLGWVVVPDEYVETANILAQNLYISASSIAQYGALAAFSSECIEILDARREAFRERRNFLSAALRDLGFELPENIQGAFYVYAGIKNFSNDCEKFCSDLLENHGVAITPGTDFGDFKSLEHVRIAFTTNMENLTLGLARLEAALKN